MTDIGSPLGEGPLGEGVLGPEPEEEAAGGLGWLPIVADLRTTALSLAALAAGVTWVPYVPPPEPTITSTIFTVTTAQVTQRVVIYEDVFYVKYPTAAVDNTVTIDKWQQPFVTFVPTSQLNYGTLNSHGNTWPLSTPTAVATVGDFGWWQQLSTAPDFRFPPKLAAQPFVPREATAENTVTPDKWLQAWKGPPRYTPIKVQTPPFVPKEATAENTQTIDKWQQPFYQATPPTQLRLSNAIYAYIEPPSNTVTIDKWQQPFSIPVPTSQLTYSNLNTTSLIWPISTPTATATPSELGWLRPFPEAPPPTQLRLSNPLYTTISYEVPPNTETIDKWQQPLSIPVPTSQLTYSNLNTAGYTWPLSPPFAVATVGDYGWWQQLSEAPAFRYPPKLVAQPFVPREATAENTVTPDKWLQKWQGPPRYWPIKVQAVAFWPKEATAENTVTVDKWQQPFYRAVPVQRPAQATQPSYGFPYEAVDNTRTEWDWSIQWQGPPSYRPPKLVAQPFVPAEATAENTITPDKWLFKWQGVPQKIRPLYAPAHLRYPAIFIDNTQTIDKWQQPFYRPVRRPPVRHTPVTYQNYPYEVAPIIDYGGPVQADVRVIFKRLTQYQAFAKPVYTPPDVSNTVTIEKWQQPLSKLPVRLRPPFFQQPVPGFTFIPEINVSFGVTEPTDVVSMSVTIFIPGWTQEGSTTGDWIQEADVPSNWTQEDDTETDWIQEEPV